MAGASRAPPPLWRTRVPRATWLLASGAVAAAATAGAAFALAGTALLGRPLLASTAGSGIELVGVGLLALTGPAALAYRARARRAREREDRFPDFVRDLAIARHAGLPLAAGARAASAHDYGALSPLVRRLVAELEANVPFEVAFRGLADAVGTPLVRRLGALVARASRAGGNVSAVLLAASRDARVHLALRGERAATMQVYVAVVYVAFGVFLLVTLALHREFLPPLIEGTGGPGVAGAAGVGLATAPALGDYRTFYVAAGLAQALGNGALLGTLTHGHPGGGMGHAFTMVVLALVAFAVWGSPP